MTHFKRVFELNPGEHFLYFGHEFIVTKIENVKLGQAETPAEKVTITKATLSES